MLLDSLLSAAQYLFVFFGPFSARVMNDGGRGPEKMGNRKH